jgi:hypothetical protein
MKNLILLSALFLALSIQPAHAGVKSGLKKTAVFTGQTLKKAGKAIEQFVVKEAKALPDEVAGAVIEAYVVIKVVPLVLPYLLGV